MIRQAQQLHNLLTANHVVVAPIIQNPVIRQGDTSPKVPTDPHYGSSGGRLVEPGGATIHQVRLRLYHHQDGARVAYRETGTGPALVLLHSLGLSHREWEPVVAPLSRRFRVVLPDLPLHGDSEDRPRHPYSPDWLADVIAGFCREVARAAAASSAGHDLGAELAAAGGQHRPPGAGAAGADAQPAAPPRRVRRPSAPRGGRRAAWPRCPGLDRVLAHGAKLVFRPALGRAAVGPAQPGGARPHPPRVRRRRRQRQPRPLVGEVRAALAGRGRSASCSTPTPQMRRCRCCCCGPTRIRPIRSTAAAEALDLLPDAQLRTLPGTGFLIAYDDPVAVARELIAFCG